MGEGDQCWTLAESWLFHEQIDRSFSAFNPYSGALMALNEASAWVIRALRTQSSVREKQLADAIATDMAITRNADVETFLRQMLEVLEEARLIRHISVS